MWWIAHEYLSNCVAKGKSGQAIDDAFRGASDNMRSMERFASDYEKKKIEEYANEYIKLCKIARTGGISRRTVEGLERLRTRIKRLLSPKDDSR